MPEYRDKITLTTELTARTTVARLECITRMKLKKGTTVYMPPNRVPYKVQEFTGPQGQWVRARPENDADAHASEVDSRFLSLERPSKQKKGERGRHG